MRGRLIATKSTNKHHFKKTKGANQAGWKEDYEACNIANGKRPTRFGEKCFSDGRGNQTAEDYADPFSAPTKIVETLCH